MLDLGYIVVKWDLDHGWHDQPASPRLFRAARVGPRRQHRLAAWLRQLMRRRSPAPVLERQERARPQIGQARQASGTPRGAAR